MIKQCKVAPIKKEQQILEYRWLLQRYEEVVAPRECQRPLCWGPKDKFKFFNSLLMNRVEGTFIFVDIQSAFESVKKVYLPTEECYQFFEDLIKDGYGYIVIDGNNRYHFLTSLYNDDWLIPQGEYQYVSDITTGKIEKFEVRSRKRRFSDLPKKIQRALEFRKSPVSEYTQVDKVGLAEIFENVNAGKPLNRQELRNVRDVLYASLVRNLEDDVVVLLNALISNQSIGLRGQEFIVDCLDFCLNGIVPDYENGGESTHHPINQNSKDQLYNESVDIDFFSKTFYSNFQLIEEYLPKMISDEILGSGNDKKVKRTSAIQNLLWMLVNGLNPSYECVVDAMKEAEKEYESHRRHNVRYRTEDSDKMSFKESCTAMNKECMNIREKILQDVIATVNQKHNVDLFDLA